MTPSSRSPGATPPAWGTTGELKTLVVITAVGFVANTLFAKRNAAPPRFRRLTGEDVEIKAVFE